MGQKEYFKKMVSDLVESRTDKLTYYLFDEQSVSGFLEACKGVYDVQRVDSSEIPAILKRAISLKLKRLEEVTV